MYEELNCFEEALKHFGTRVEVITAMEMSRRISPEDAYQMIKDCLLYTSPSPRDATLSRMPSSA